MDEIKFNPLPDRPVGDRSPNQEFEQSKKMSRQVPAEQKPDKVVLSETAQRLLDLKRQLESLEKLHEEDSKDNEIRRAMEEVKEEMRGLGYEFK